METTAQSQITVTNPANREVIGHVTVSTAEQIRNTVDRAQRAFRIWRLQPLQERLLKIEKFRKLLFNNRESVARQITRETGKPEAEALVSEVFASLETCAWITENAERILAPEKVSLNPLFFPGKRSYNVFEPFGVIAVIAPWNYPFSIPVSSMLAALAVGNSVVLKPSPKTAFVGQRIIELLVEAGFPSDVVGLVQGDRLEVETLIDAPISRIMFTGSVAGGKAIMGLAAKKLLPVTLELGGKHAALVLKESDIDAIAKPLLWAAFTNCGQACASVERVYAEEPIARKLAERLGLLASKLRIGNGHLSDSDVGPVIDEAQLTRIDNMIAEAVKQGARVIAGGHSRLDLGGFFYEPTVLVDVNPEMAVAREEIFGPVLPIIAVADASDAIRLANDSHLGLGASIWTPDLARGETLAREIEAGMVWINDGLYTHVCPDAPWGGIKESGFGRMHSASELRDLVYIKNIGINAPKPQAWNYPYNESSLAYVKGGVELTHSRTPAGILSGLSKIILSMTQSRKS